MKQRISAGGIVVQNGKLLLVHHFEQGEFDFWVLPGGGVEGNEGVLKAAEREVLEETNLTVRAEKIAYFEDFIDEGRAADEGRYVCKFWVYCIQTDGHLTTEYKDADETFLQDAKFCSKEEIQEMNVFPSILKDGFWEDLAAGFSEIKYLGYNFGRPFVIKS